VTRHTLFVTLAETRYRIERPWGELPKGGRVTDVACDSRGHVFVLLRADAYVDPEAPAVIELDPTGRAVSAWGGDLIADGHMIACGPDDRLYVVDRDAHEIIVFDTAGRRVGGIGKRDHPGEPFCHPCDVAIAPSGDIYVADGYGASHVHRFGANGALIATWGTPGAGAGQFTTPHAIWALADGRLAVADRENHRVQVFSGDGAFLCAWGDFHKPMDIFGDASGRIYVTDQIPRLSVLSNQGELVGRCRPVLNGAHGIWGDAAGHIYLAEGNPSRISRLVPV
jgi:DNA-binding beta-propeller fold protein YncE